jgi:hypothetical protein
MRSSKTKIGDVFSVPLDESSKKYFQYIADDLSQLNSSVIRAFKKAYAIDSAPDLQKIVSDDVDFYAHVVIKWGIKLNLWEKVGNVPFAGRVEVLFRDTNDYGNPEVKSSSNWYVWKVNQEFKQVGKLEGEYRNAEIGIVVAPPDIAHRMRTGEYEFLYPEY